MNALLFTGLLVCIGWGLIGFCGPDDPESKFGVAFLWAANVLFFACVYTFLF